MTLLYAIEKDSKTKEYKIINQEDAKKLGWNQFDLDVGYDGKFYLKGFAPEKPIELIAEEVRATRNTLLSETDKFMTIDYPITDEEKQNYIKYREYLRYIPDSKDFPNIEVLTFEQWKGVENGTP